METLYIPNENDFKRWINEALKEFLKSSLLSSQTIFNEKEKLMNRKEIANLLDIEESTSRSQYTRAKAMLEDILVKKRIIHKPGKKTALAASMPR